MAKKGGGFRYGTKVEEEKKNCVVVVQMKVFGIVRTRVMSCN